VTTGAIRRAKLQSKCRHQQATTQFLILQPGCPSCRPTNSVRALKEVLTMICKWADIHINELLWYTVPRGQLDTPCLPSAAGRQRRCTDALTYCHNDNFCLCQDDAYIRAGACGNINSNNNLGRSLCWTYTINSLTVITMSPDSYAYPGIKIGRGWPKMEEWNEWSIKHFWLIYMVLKSRDYLFKMSVFNKLSIVLYSVHWYMYYVHIKKLSLRAAVVANRSITASMLGCQIGGFVASYDTQGVSPPLKLWVQFNVQCECCKWNKLFLPYNFFLRGDWGWLWSPWPPPGMATPLARFKHQQTRSAAVHQLTVPRVRHSSTFCCRAFASVRPTVWNSLPEYLRSNPATRYDQFGRNLNVVCSAVYSVS